MLSLGMEMGRVWLRKKHLHVPRWSPSVRRGVSERRCRDADTLILSVIHTVEPLKPALSVDKVKAPARVVPRISNDEVDPARGAAYGAIERPRPDLGIGRELKDGLQNSAQEILLCHAGGIERTHTTDLKEQALQVRKLGGTERQEPSGGIGGGTGCCLVLLKGIGGDQHKSGAWGDGSEIYGGMHERLKHTSINDSSGGRQDSSAARAVCDSLINPPVVARRRCGCDRATGYMLETVRYKERRLTQI